MNCNLNCVTEQIIWLNEQYKNDEWYSYLCIVLDKKRQIQQSRIYLNDIIYEKLVYI